MKKAKESLPIGIFDSGVGALTIYKEIKKLLPNEDIIYFGDTLRCPYGAKDAKTLRGYGKQIINFLNEQDVKAIVIGCNTMSATALKYLQEYFEVPLIDVISSGVKDALKVTTDGNIGLFATKSTVASNVFDKLIKKNMPNAIVSAVSCPLFAPLVEEGFVESDIVSIFVNMYVAELNKDIDTLILGCTHYPLLLDAIQSAIPNVTIIDPAIGTATALQQFLIEKNLQNSKHTKDIFYVTSDSENFDRQCYKFLQKSIKGIKVSL